MRGVFLWMMTVVGLVACDNSVKVEVKTDRLKKQLDTSLDRLKDSVKAKGERTLDAVQDKINDLGKKKDSLPDTTK